MVDIRQGMDVLSSDGEIVGRTGLSDAGRIAVVPGGGGGGGTRDVPPDWITRVDEHVHLRHSAAMLRAEWRGDVPRPAPSEGRARLPWLIGIVLLLIAVFLLFWGLVYNADGDRNPEQPMPSTGQGNLS
jgi:hypothetical protein